MKFNIEHGTLDKIMYELLCSPGGMTKNDCYVHIWK